VLAGLEPYFHLIAVGGGLLLALLALTWLGRASRGGRQRAQTVVGLTPGHALHVVEVAGRRLLVGTGPSGPPALLLELPDPGTPSWAAAPASGPPPWGEGARRGPDGWTSP
jgi:hypothetical protein